MEFGRVNSRRLDGAWRVIRAVFSRRSLLGSLCHTMDAALLVIPPCGPGLSRVEMRVNRGLQHCTCLGGRAFTSGGGGGGSIEPAGRTPAAPKKGSIGGTPKILPRLSPVPRR